MTDFLQVQNISFSYADDDANPCEVLHDVSFSVEQGEYVLIAGANGSGKSTLARIICGFLSPLSGTVTGRAFRSEQFVVSKAENAVFSVPSGLVFQDPKDQITASIVQRDTAFGPENLHLAQSESTKRVQEALELTSLTDSALQKTVTLSSGQKQRLALAGICALYPHLLVLDEALSMIDPAGRREILSFLRSWHAKGGTVIHITHDEEAALEAERLLFLEHGSLVFDGTPKSFCAQNDFFAPLPPLSSVSKGDSIPAAENGASKPEAALAFENVCYGHTDAELLFNQFSLTFRRGTLTAITGASGTGKTTLFELASGLLCPASGSINSENRAVLAQQDCANALFEEFAADDVAYGAREQGLSGSALKKRVASAMNKAGVPFAEFADKRIASLSGGQRRKLSIAGILALDSPVLLFDEPTAGLDPQSRSALFALFYELCSEGKTIVFTTHRADEAAASERHITLGRKNGTGECIVLSDSDNTPLETHLLRSQSPLADASLLASFTQSAAGFYSMKNTPVHRLSPLAKYLVLLAFLGTGICFMSLPLLVADCLLCFVYACMASYPIKRLFLNFLKILPWIGLFFVFQMLFFPAQAGDVLYWRLGFVSITDAKILLGIRTILHYIAVLIPVSVFVSSTEETEIIDGLKTLLKPLEIIKVPTRHAVLTVSIIFRFLPLLMEETASILKAQLIRSGGSLSKKTGDKGLFSRVRVMIPLFVPLIIRTLKRAESLAQALLARYYH